MSLRSRVEELLAEFLQTRSDLFLVEMKFSADNNITIMLDGDNGVTLQDCLDASRSIEFNLDREQEDFGLQVMSFGLSESLRFKRQYEKNIGRELDILLKEGSKIQGELLRVEDDRIVLLLKYRRPKLVGKGKEDVEEEKEILLEDINKAYVVIKF